MMINDQKKNIKLNFFWNESVFESELINIYYIQYNLYILIMNFKSATSTNCSTPKLSEFKLIQLKSYHEFENTAELKKFKQNLAKKILSEMNS